MLFTTYSACCHPLLSRTTFGTYPDVLHSCSSSCVLRLLSTRTSVIMPITFTFPRVDHIRSCTKSKADLSRLSEYLAIYFTTPLTRCSSCDTRHDGNIVCSLLSHSPRALDLFVYLLEGTAKLPWYSDQNIIHELIELCSYFSIHPHAVWIPFTTDLYSLGLRFPATDQIAVIHHLYSSMYTCLAFYLCDYLSLVLPSSFVCATDLYDFPTYDDFLKTIDQRRRAMLLLFYSLPHSLDPLYDRPLFSWSYVPRDRSNSRYSPAIFLHVYFPSFLPLWLFIASFTFFVCLCYGPLLLSDILYFICTTIKVIVILNTQTFYVFNLVYIFICISSASFSIYFFLPFYSF